MNEQLNDQESENLAPADGGGSSAAGAGNATANADTQTATETPSIEDLQRDLAALQDRLLRTAAEFDNYRKRIDRERRELSEYAASDVLLELLPIIDNLERALVTPGAEDDPVRKGVELIHKQMLDVVRKRGVRPIEAAGAMFDPKYHNAVIHEESSEHPDGEVIQELQRGYMLGDRLLRPAMVKVAKSS
jgi:molecular chaperone GrpE